MRHSSARVTEIYIHNLYNRSSDIYDRLKNNIDLRFNRQTTQVEIIERETTPYCVKY